jgi:beta-glucosidase/6-phospho-beta-glucosidase/beta-galactosidase
MSSFDKFKAARPVAPPITIDQIRLERNKALARTDWTQVPDSPLSPEKKQQWAVYRQGLRDMLNNVTDPAGVVWPVQPK